MDVREIIAPAMNERTTKAAERTLRFNIGMLLVMENSESKENQIRWNLSVPNEFDRKVAVEP